MQTILSCRAEAGLAACMRREKAPFLLFIEVINEPRPGDQPVSDTGAAASGDVALLTANGLHGDAGRRHSDDAAGPGEHKEPPERLSHG